MTVVEYAVTFDLWNTLIAEEPSGVVGKERQKNRALGALAILREHDVNVNLDALISALDAAQHRINIDHESGLDLVFPDRLGQILSMVDRGLMERLSSDTLERIACEMDRAFLNLSPSVIEGAIEALEMVRKIGLKTALISNTGLTSPAGYVPFLESTGLAKYLDVLTFSNEIAVAKPSAEIFTRTLEKLKVPSWAAFHVGDSLFADVSGAGGVGMQTAWIVGKESRAKGVKPDFLCDDIKKLPDLMCKWVLAKPGPPLPPHKPPETLS